MAASRLSRGARAVHGDSSRITCLIVTWRLTLNAGPAVAHYPPAATFGPVTLRDFEFVWLLSGAALWESEGAAAELRPGLLLLARPGMKHRFVWSPHVPSVHGYVHFSIGDANGLPTRDWRTVRPLSPDGPARALCRYLLELGSVTSCAAAQRQRAATGWLLELFLDPVLAPSADRPLHPYLVRVIDYVATQWQDGVARPLSVAELAAAAGVSPGHLTRLFTSTFAVGPAAAIELVRLARAATLLLRSNLRVGDVASAGGFANAFHFSRRFRQVYGMPPTAYRSMNGPREPQAPMIRAGLAPLATWLLFDRPG
jgi:AraC family transcriptional regulator